MRRIRTGFVVLIAMVVSSMAATSATAVTLDFETEDDFVTPLINGQIVDPAFDAIDLEFGNLVNISSTQIGGGSGHLGVTVFDSSDPGPNDGGADPDLLVNLGNILILQNDAFSSTSVDGTVGLIRDTPNDEADTDDRGSIIFDFLGPVVPVSIDLVDVNGGVNMKVTLTDGPIGGVKTRVYDVPSMWTNDGSINPIGYHTLDLRTLLAQTGDPGPPAAPGVVPAPTEDLGFDISDVRKIEVEFAGSSPSGGVDNLVFIPEPSSLVVWTLLGLVGIAVRFWRRPTR